VNRKFLNSLSPEWSKFVTDVKLVKDLHTTNFDQLHAYLEQHKLHENEVRLLCEHNQDPLVFVANQHMTPPHFNTYQSSYNNPQLQQQFSQSQYGSIHPNQHYLSTYPSQPQFNHSSVQPTYPYQSQMNYQTLSVPQIAYQSPQVSTQPITESPLVDFNFVVPVFSPGDDPIACLNKAMAFVTIVASSRFPSTNSQLRTSSNLRNQATIQDGSHSATSEGHMARQCTQHKGKRNTAWYKEKAMFAKLRKLTEDLDTYDSDCDDSSIMNKRFLWPTFPTMVLTLSQREKLALKEQVDSLEQNLSKQIKEKECLLQTFTIFKNESKEKEDKYMENEIDLEKKIKELDNILFKWRISNPSSKPSDASSVKIEAPKELPKVSLVNESLKNHKFHLARFDNVVKIRTTPDARTEGEWGFEHTKAVFNNEIIPFLKSLKDIFNVFDKDLLNEIMEVQTVFDQMDAAVQQSSVDKQCLEIAKKELLLENDRLLQQIMSQDVLLTMMNSMSLIGESVNMERKRNESCDKCFNLDAELLKTQNAHNDLLKKFFENNDLKAQLQDKDTTIYKLKEIIKSMREKFKEENVNYDYCETETKNVELENSVAKLLSENERLCKEINHVKHVFKDQFDSIKKTRVRTKEQSDSLIDKLNLKSAENEDLKAQIQDKVFVITSLKNDLRKLKGKEIVDIVAQTPSAHTIIPGMFKLDLEPLAPRLFQKREIHIEYLKYTQEQADILWGIVKQAKAKQPLDKELDFVCKHAQRIQELLVYVQDTCPNAIKLNEKKVNVTPKNKVNKVRKPKNVKNVGSSKKAKIVESKNANHSEPNHTWGSNATNILSSSSFVKTGCPDYSLISGLWMFETHDGTQKPPTALSSETLLVNLDVRLDRDRIIARIRGWVTIMIGKALLFYKEYYNGPQSFNSLTPATSSLGLAPNPVSQQHCIPPPRDDWDRFFQPIFDEYFTPPSIAISPVQEAAAPRAVVLADSPVSTSFDQDAPSSSTASTQEQEQSPNISQGSSSNVRQTHTPFEHLGKWTKNHPIANIIGDPSRSVSTRKQLQTDAMWCYFDAFLTFVEPKNFKQAMTEPSWIDAMQEEIHEFQRLESLRLFYNTIPYMPYEIVKKYGMLSSDSVDTPMVEKSKLDEDLQGKPVDATLYRGMIDSLKIAKPTKKHLNAVKRIFCHLKGTINMGIWYSKDTGMSLSAYDDADQRAVSGSLNAVTFKSASNS
ncbi:hypothetical protein Tco_1073899, partial [Tanacetum coccineum]